MIEIETKNGIAVVTLMHGKANTLDVEFCTALAGRFKELAKSKAHAVVVTGQGRIFSAGVDLKRLRSTPAEKIRPCPVTTTACAFDFANSLKRPASAVQNSTSSVLALPCIKVTTAIPFFVSISIMSPRAD